MSTSEVEKKSIQQSFTENKPMFIAVAMLVGLLCATFLVQPTEERLVEKVRFKRCLIMSDFTYQGENYRGGNYITGIRCESLLNDSKELERFVKPSIEKYSIDVADRSSEWFARIVTFLVSGALSALLLSKILNVKKRVSNLASAVEEKVSVAKERNTAKLIAAKEVNERLVNSSTTKENFVEAMGATGKITVDEVFITISREGSTGLNKLQNRFSQGYQGEKRIAIAQISAVQFKSVGEYGKGVKSLMKKIPGGEMYDKAFGNVAGATGYIEFVVIGSAEKKGRMLLGGLQEMARNENAIMFGSEQEEAFAKIRDLVEGKIRDRYASKPAEPVQAAQLDVASQISSLKGLFDSGAISEDEFQKAKAKVLGI